jgi:hypothetical protein
MVLTDFGYVAHAASSSGKGGGGAELPSDDGVVSEDMQCIIVKPDHGTIGFVCALNLPPVRLTAAGAVFSSTRTSKPKKQEGKKRKRGLWV